MAYTTENIEKAVHEFYIGGTKYGEAHQWLTTAQVSMEAWSFCWDLMSPSKPPEIQFFGASCLQVKISKHWNELPADQLAPLKKKLLDYIINYSSGPKIVLTRLCIAISSYVIHTISEYWTKAITEIIEVISPQNIPNLLPENVYGILIEILTVLPEEFLSSTLTHSFRGTVRHALRSGIPQVLPVMHQILSSPCSSELRLQAIKCFASWIQFGIPLPDCEPLLTLLLEAAHDATLSSGALDCLSTLMCHQDVHKYSVSLQRLIGHSLRLEALVPRCLAEGDTDGCYGVYYLFTNVAETHSHLLLENVLPTADGELRDNTLRLVQQILQCTGTPGQFPVDETCSGLVFNFWYMLQDDIKSSDVDKRDVYMSYFVPVYSSLVDILITKSIFPNDDVYSTWSSDDKEQFRCYRQDIGDTLMYCYEMLREPMLQKLNSHMETVLIKLNSNDPAAWQLLEACLFAFESIAESIDLEEQHFLPQLFACLPNIPFNNYRVIDTALATIGAYAEWIQLHPEILGHIIPLLVTGLRNSDMAPAATRALREISRDCQHHMKPFAHQILMESQQSMANNIILPSECIRLMCTIGRVLSVIEVDEILSYLTNLLTPFLQELEQLAAVKPSRQLQARLLTILNMLSVLFANLDTKLKLSGDPDDDNNVDPSQSMATDSNAIHPPAGCDTGSGSGQPPAATGPQPVLIVMQQILPIIHKVGVNWCRVSEVTEAICDLLKKCVTNLLDDCLPLMPDILNLMVILYANYPTIGVLDLAKQFLLIFAGDENHQNLLRQMFANIVNVTMALCDKGIAEHTDIVQGFMQVLAQVLKKVSTFLIHDDFNISALFHCGIVALSLQESPTVKAASSFLVTFINQSKAIPVMNNVVREHGEALVEQILRCIGGEVPRGVIDHMSDILLSLNKNYFDNLCHWMTPMIQRPNFPSVRLTTDQKDHYVRQILRERVNKRKLQEIVKEFTLVCRGLMGTEYANQIMPYLSRIDVFRHALAMYSTAGQVRPGAMLMVISSI